MAPGNVVTVTLDAHDPDCATTCTSGCGQYVRSDLTSWSSTGGSFLSTDNGTSGSPYLAVADWQAPDTEGLYTISVYVADSGGFACGGRQSVTPTVDIQVTTSTNQAPVVDTLTASRLQLFPGQTSELQCAGSDPDGDTISYGWETDSGVVTPGADGAATLDAGEPGPATVTCTVTDSGGLFGSSSIVLSVSGAVADAAMISGLVAPLRLSVDLTGLVYVVDPSGGGLAVVDLFDGRLLYHVRLPEITSVGVDWNGDLLVGSPQGARLVDRHGDPNTTVTFSDVPADVVDVAIDHASRRYGILSGSAARIAVYDEFGTQVLAFGSTGDAPDQFRGPRGLAVTAAGQWVVADSGHGLIKVFDSAGTLVSSFGGLGGGIGEFVRLDDIAVDAAGVIYASDSYQDWIQAFNPDGTLRESLGTYGADLGQFMTPTGVTSADTWDRLLVASTNSSSIQVFRTSDAPIAPPPPAVPSLAPTSLSFPGEPVGGQSASQTLTLANLGGSILGLQRVTTGGDFDQSNNCGKFVDSGQSCELQVSFSPSVPGARTGTLTIDSSGEPSRVAANLAGTGFVPLPRVELAPALLVFGDQQVGTVSTPLAVSLTNTGLAGLEISEIGISAGYLQSNDCPNPLAAGTGCTIQVRFAPTAVAEHVYGSLSVSSTATGSPHAMDLDGRATPVVPQIAVADRTIDEGDAGQTTQAIFAVSLSEPTTEVVTVYVETVSETAVVGEDYSHVSDTVTFLPGETTQNVAVPVLGDAILEPDEETFAVLLSNPVNAVFAVDRGLGTITDDEPCVGPELLANASAEDRPTGAGVPGWTQVAGTTWQRRAAPPMPIDGVYYFHPGATDPVELAQEVDVTAYRDKIDSGTQWFSFAGWVHTLYEADPRTARVVVEYRDIVNTMVLDAFDTGEFSSPSIWQRVADERPAPIGTGWIRVRLISTHLGDASFDAVSLRSLRTATVSIDDQTVYERDLGIRPHQFPLRLACPFSEAVYVDYMTVDQTALAGEDYLADVGRATFEPGETEESIPVEIVGDETDEGHEAFGMQLSLVGPPEAVLLDPLGVCTIRNDDYCPETTGFWRDNPGGWPVEWLEIGGVEYDRAELLALLDYSGPDQSHLLAAELIAVRLNLATGSDPLIEPEADAADAFLVQYPPGSQPTGAAKQQARELSRRLHEYDARPCRLTTTEGIPGMPVEVSRRDHEP